MTDDARGMNSTPVPAPSLFLAGSDLPARWQGRTRFVVLETGFGLGSNFLATWSAWRDDPARCEHLHYIGIEAAPPARNGLGSIGREVHVAALAEQLARAWPPLTSDLHRLAFEGGAVQLSLAFGHAGTRLTKIVAEVDAFCLDAFTTAGAAALREPRRYRVIGRLAGAGATVVAFSAATSVHDGLISAGFALRGCPEQGSPGDVMLARFQPRFTPRAPAPRRFASLVPAGASHEPVLIVGAGLAGCATACALAEQGRSSIVVDRCTAVAEEGSGNAAGLFHGIVHRADGRHARFHRAAALAAVDAVQAALARGERGSVGGLLRVEPGAADRELLQQTIDRLGLPADFVRAVDAGEASRLAGTPIAAPGWYFASGGWVDPRGLARSYLARAAGLAELRTGTTVASLRRDGDRWLLTDASGRVLARAAVVVLANAGGALALLRAPAWPIGRRRGQMSSLAASNWAAATMPAIPVAGAGYVVPAIDGNVWFGATSQDDDDDTGVRDADHRHNLERLSRLLALPPSATAAPLGGRTGFRWVADDRLPVIGAVPRADAMTIDPAAALSRGATRLDQPRLIERTPGLFVFTALGSRGIATSALGGRVIAAAITGAPSPLEADLLDAIDPARFLSRAFRRRNAGVARGRRAADQLPVGPIAAGSPGA